MALSYIEYTGDGSTNSFSVPFEYIAQADIKVFVDGVEDTSITFTSPSIVQTSSSPTTGALVRVERNTDITSRAVDFASGSILTEEDLDNSNTQVFFASQEAIDTANDALSTSADGKFNAEVGGVNRAIKNVADPTNPQDVATKNYVENTWLSPSDKAQLNAIDTTKLHTVADDIANVNTTASNITDVNTVGGAITNVNTVAGDIANVNTTATNIADVNTVATNIADINTVENSIANVNTTATNITDVNTVATNIGDINTVEDSIANVNAVGNDIANVNTTAGSITNVNTVATNVADVNTTAGSITNVNNVGGSIANVNTVATSIANVNTVATDIAKVNQVADDITKVIATANDLLESNGSEIETVAASIANVDAVGTDIANVNTVATNITNVNAFAETYFIGATAPSSPTEGDLWFDTSVQSMKVYGSGGWQLAGSSINGTSARYDYVVGTASGSYDGSSTTTFPATYDSGYVDVYLNGVKLKPTTDFTATNGTSVVLALAASAGDELSIVGFGTFDLANFSVGDANDVDLSTVANGDGLIYSSTSGNFEPVAVATQSDLTNVEATVNSFPNPVAMALIFGG
jgi:hypothetical protein